MAIIAPEGSALSVAVIGVADLEASLRFYRDIIGLSPRPAVTWSGPDFERHWRLPPGASAQAVFCELPGVEVGRVLLLSFNAAKRKPIRPLDAHMAFGLGNLNFYTDTIVEDSKRLSALGYRFWSDPTHYVLSGSTGAPTEVVFDGPDTVFINLVELTSGDPSTRIGQMRAYVEKHGRTPTGFTPVVTTSHCVRSMGKAVAFYEQMLKMGVLIDVIMDRPEQNRFQRLAEKSKTAVKFMQGNHMFGKVALIYPMNYPCMDLVHNAIAPNIGYIAQTFVVKDLTAAKAASDSLKADVFSSPMELEMPGFGRVAAMIVRNPGSGALQQIVQQL